jgi:hypothetical protein
LSRIEARALFEGAPPLRARSPTSLVNHPYIGAIYGLEESRGMRALVLELIDDPTLA